MTSLITGSNHRSPCQLLPRRPGQPPPRVASRRRSVPSCAGAPISPVSCPHLSQHLEECPHNPSSPTSRGRSSPTPRSATISTSMSPGFATSISQSEPICSHGSSLQVSRRPARVLHYPVHRHAREDGVSSSSVNGTNDSFWVCEKSDGVRVLLFVVMNGMTGSQEVWLVSIIQLVATDARSTASRSISPSTTCTSHTGSHSTTP